MDPRNAHVGKSETERQQYHAFLRRPQAEDPTYDSDEPDLTNVPRSATEDRVGSGGEVRRPYTPQRERALSVEQLVGLIVGVFLFVLTGLIGLFAISLNREVGVLSERQGQVRSGIEANDGRLDLIERALLELQLKFEMSRQRSSPDSEQ